MQKQAPKYSSAPTVEKVATLAGWLTDKKAAGLLALDLSGFPALTDAVIIATANSVRHAQSLADFVLEQSRGVPYEFLHMEGYNTGQWILVDFNDVIIHIFQQETRELFCLEDLWPKANVLTAPAEAP